MENFHETYKNLTLKTQGMNTRGSISMASLCQSMFGLEHLVMFCFLLNLVFQYVFMLFFSKKYCWQNDCMNRNDFFEKFMNLTKYQNCGQKVFNRGLYVCAGWLDILKSDKNSTDSKCFICQFGAFFGSTAEYLS